MPIKLNTLPSQDELLSLLDYNPKSGEFTWKKRHNIKNGTPAGGIDKSGYHQIKFMGKFYFSARLAWKMVVGRDPLEEIDHINGNRSDNRICNLREATHRENTWNTKWRPRRNKVLPGVKKQGSLWAARIQSGKERVVVGGFLTPDQAFMEYAYAKIMIHGQWSRSVVTVPKFSAIGTGVPC